MRDTIKDYYIGLGGKKHTIGITFTNNMSMDQLQQVMKDLNATTFRRAPAMNTTSYNGAAFDFTTKELQNAIKILEEKKS